MAVATPVISEEEDAVAAVAEEVAGVMRAETAAVSEILGTEETTHRLSGTTVAGSVNEIGGTVNEIVSVDDAPRQAPGDRHPGEISETATFR